MIDAESLSDAIERIKAEREQCAAEVHRLREDNSRLVNMLEEKRQRIVSFDGRSVFVDGMGELDVDSADALLQENAALRAELAAMREDLNDARSNWEAAVEYGRERDAELAECRKDAERYLHLRNMPELEIANGIELVHWVNEFSDGTNARGEAADQAIDAAMQAASGKGGE